MTLPWDKIGDAVKSGRYNLLIGAGASLDSESGYPKVKCPSTFGLMEALQDALPDVRKGSSLNRLYRSMRPSQVDELITRRFANCIPGDTVNAIARFRWKRIFTLNVDDALEGAYERTSLPVQSHKPINYNQPYESIRDLRILPIVHLHGWSRRSEDSYVFDIKSYMRTVAQNNIWAHVLGDLIRTEPFIVLGTSLEEPDLSFFLSDRANVIARADRPPSLIIEPAPDAGTAQDCKEYDMALYEGTALQFLSEIDSRFPVRPSVTDAIEDNLGDLSKLDVKPIELAEFHSDFERVPDHLPSGGDGGTNFAYGHAATWQDIQNDRDLARTQTSDWQSRVLRSTTSTFIIDGAAGAGKSTTLRRMAWNIAQSGHLCFWLRSVGRIRINSAANIFKAIRGRCFVFIDNFADHVGEVSTLRELLKSNPITFVGAERNYRLSHVERVFGKTFLQSEALTPIGESLAQDLVKAYTNYGLAASRGTDSNRFPLKEELIAIACCRILNNFEPLATIVDRSVADATPKDADCYIFAALAAHCYRQGIEYDLISRQFPEYQVDIQTEGDQPLPLKLEVVSDSEFVTPLNEAVSDTLLKRFAGQKPERVLRAFRRLAEAIRPRVSVPAIVRGDPCCRIASRLFDFDDVVKPLLGMKGAEEFYAEAKKDWEWNSRYWHQIAQFRLECANESADGNERRKLAELAVQHARFAKTIEPDHQFTTTTIGRILFGKMRVLRQVHARELDEAIDSLCRASEIERTKNRASVHPFMILFQGLAEACRNNAVLSNDQKRKIGSQVDRALAAFPRDVGLIEEARNIRRLI
ncbi:MAG: SIR2 family protein [Rhodopseudomonas sp.]|nr:SIR2 family protein [Rhodopseudomonas sp.]